MEQLVNYVKPELLIVAVVLYFMGIFLKEAQPVKDKYIPLILGGISVVVCAVMCLLLRSLRVCRTLSWEFLLRLPREFSQQGFLHTLIR